MYYGTQKVTEREVKAIKRCEAWFAANERRVGILKVSSNKQAVVIERLIKGCRRTLENLRKGHVPKGIRRTCFDRDGRVSDLWGYVVREAGIKDYLQPFFGPLEIKAEYDLEERVGEFGARWWDPGVIFTTLTGVEVVFGSELYWQFEDLHVLSDSESYTNKKAIEILSQIKYSLEKLAVRRFEDPQQEV